MGTTRDHLRSGDSIDFRWVLCIEGCEYLLTDHDSTSAVTTAWTGTDWTQALSGLKVDGQFEQGLTPWEHDISVPTLRFEVVPQDDDDTFGELIFKTIPGAYTQLGDVFSGDTGATTLSGKDFGDFNASGTVFLGTTQIDYASKTGSDTLNISANKAGIRSPFAVSGGTNQFPRPAALPGGEGPRIGPRSIISDTQRIWHGKMVGLWAHRIVDGVLDTKAQAELMFAGKIIDIQDTGLTSVLECEDIRGTIKDSVILRDQYKARIKEGYRVREGEQWVAVENAGGTGTDKESNSLIGTTGASGANQIEPGYYSAEELLEKMNEWLANETDNSRLTFNWSCAIVADEGMSKCRIDIDNISSFEGYLQLHATQRRSLEFLGYSEDQYHIADNGEQAHIHTTDSTPFGGGYGDAGIVSENAPKRVMIWQAHRFGSANVVVEVERTEGAWYDNSSDLPHPMSTVVGSGEDWGVLRMGPLVILAKKSGDSFDSLTASPALQKLLPDSPSRISLGSELDLTVDQPGDLMVTQIPMVAGSFSDIVTKLFATIQGDGVNSATYDTFAFGGCAIPWELLGDGFTDSVKAVEQSTEGGHIALVLEKPKTVWNILKPEFILRNCHLIWKDGGLQFTHLQTPNAENADHTLTEDNKAAAVEDSASFFTASRKDMSFMRNVIKVENGRTIDNKYKGHPIVGVYEDAINDFGGTERPFTIKAANNWDAITGSGPAAEVLAAELIARSAPWSRPISVWRRSIAPPLYHMAPGDTVSLSDDHVRDPATGTRGITSKGGTVLAVRVDYETLFGEVDIIFTEENRTFSMSPAAEIDETHTTGGYTAGYDSGSLKIYLKSNAYSNAANDSDDNTHFEVDDEVTVIERDPAASGSAQSWNVTITAVSGNEVTIDAALTGHSSSVFYRMVPRTYSNCQASQLSHAFQADDADGQIEDTTTPNSFADTRQNVFTSFDGTNKPSLHANESYGDGAPIHPGIGYDLAALHSNRNNYRTAPQMGGLHHDESSLIFTTTGATYETLWQFPVFLGPPSPDGLVRKLNIGPRFKDGGSGTTYIKIYLSAQPVKGDSFDDPTFAGTTQEYEWSTTSSTLVNGTAQAIAPVPSVINSRGGSAEVTWVTVVGKAVWGGLFAGIHTCYLGPME